MSPEWKRSDFFLEKKKEDGWSTETFSTSGDNWGRRGKGIGESQAKRVAGESGISSFGSKGCLDYFHFTEKRYPHQSQHSKQQHRWWYRSAGFYQVRENLKLCIFIDLKYPYSLNNEDSIALKNMLKITSVSDCSKRHSLKADTSYLSEWLLAPLLDRCSSRFLNRLDKKQRKRTYKENVKFK